MPREDATLLALEEDGGRDYRTRNVAGLQYLEKKEMDSPLVPPEGILHFWPISDFCSVEL